LDDDICQVLAHAREEVICINTIDGCHDEADLSSVGGAGEMCVNLLGLVLVQADETVQNVITGQSVIIPSFVVWEVILHWADGQLLLESIDLVQEQDNRCLNEPP